MFTCHICGMTSKYKHHLVVHIRIHTGERPYECEICNKKFRKNSDLKRHNSTHQEGVEQCTLCPKVFKNRDSMRRHLTKIHSVKESYKCELCGEKFKIRFEMEKHMSSHDVKLFTCECLKIFFSESEYEKHVKDECQAVRSNLEAEQECTVENMAVVEESESDEAVVESSDNVQKQQTNFHSTEENHECELCGEKFKTHFKIEKHLCSSNNMEECSENYDAESNGVVQSTETNCYMNDSAENLENHTSTQDMEMFTCECLKLFFTKTEYEKHAKDECQTLKNNLGAPQEFTEENVPVEEKLEIDKETEIDTSKYSCAICRENFSEYNSLASHTCNYTKDKSWTCSICEKQFSYYSGLISHMTTHKEYIFACKQCDKKFTTEEPLMLHIEEHKSGYGNTFQCGICLKFFRTEELFRKHKEGHRQTDDEQQTKKEQMYPCPQCGNMYKSPMGLQMHLRRHTNELFKCYYCNKAYTSKDNLRDHIRTHTGEMPHQCDICDKKFVDKRRLICHKRTHQSDKKTFNCDLCDKGFTRVDTLRIHQTVMHSVKNYECKICGQKCKTRYLLKRHLIRHKTKETDGSGRICKICHADYSSEGLEEHMLTHDVKPFKCDCSELFFSESEYKEHVKDDCEVVKSGLEGLQDFELKNEIKEELEIGFEGIKEEYNS